MIIKDTFSRENEVLKEKVQNYEKKLVNNATEIQELHKEIKSITLERDHLKGISQKYLVELEEKEQILNLSLSPLKKGKITELMSEQDYIESDIINVFFLNL